MFELIKICLQTFESAASLIHLEYVFSNWAEIFQIRNLNWQLNEKNRTDVYDNFRLDYVMATLQVF